MKSSNHQTAKSLSVYTLQVILMVFLVVAIKEIMTTGKDGKHWTDKPI